MPITKNPRRVPTLGRREGDRNLRFPTPDTPDVRHVGEIHVSGNTYHLLHRTSTDRYYARPAHSNLAMLYNVVFHDPVTGVSYERPS